MVREFVEGETLDRRLGGRPLPLDALLGIALQVTDALAGEASKWTTCATDAVTNGNSAGTTGPPFPVPGFCRESS